jgi:two-component system, OmpR family, sensor kinase
MARLHSRIYLHFLGVLVVAGLVGSLVFAVGARGTFVREAAERMVRHVASLAGERFGDRAALAERLRQLHADLDIDVVVRDLDGRVVAAAGRALPPLSDRQAATVRAGTVVVDSHPTWRAAAPVRDPQTRAIVGTLEGATPRRFGGPRLLWPVLAVTAILLVVAAATRPLARRISRPLERLTEAARRLGQGDLGVRAPDPRAPSSRRWTRRFSPDVDELRELTRSFNDMADRVERLVRGQRELLANVSHELRSPLARIRVALALLPQDGDSERRIRDVESDLAELDRLIEDVLTTSRLDATGLPVHLAAVDPNQILTQVAERARQDPVVAGREVRVIPGPSTPVIADAALLRRALWNLVDNAVKYGAPPITLAVTRQGDRVSFSVTDEGAGIAPEERERVTQPFYRSDVPVRATLGSARTPGPGGEPPRGVGLGLTLARRVAEVHDGALAIGPASTDGGRERGCRVVITIPASPDRASD